MNFLSLCLIARDEADSIGECLRSARGVADELIVVDTGSRDATRELAASEGARVFDFAWTDDFSAARNHSLERASGAWCLVLDADERLHGDGARAKLEAFAARGPERVGQVTIENVGAVNGASRALVSRFFARDGRTRFVGRIHEQLERDGRSPERAPTGVRVQHLGYSAGAIAAKHKLERNRRLIERALAECAELGERADDGYLWYQLGRTESLAERHEDALAALERALERCPPGANWGVEALEIAAYSLRALGRSRQALALLGEVESEFCERADLCFTVALLAMDIGDLARAERGFRRALALGEQLGPGEVSLAACSVAPAHNLGVMCEVLGRQDEAAEWYRRALAFDAAYAPSRAGLARVERRAPSANGAAR